MASTITKAILLVAAVTVGRCMEHFCPEGDCTNITIYLGPRFGSKTILLRNGEVHSLQENDPSSTTNNFVVPSIKNISTSKESPENATVSIYLGPKWGHKTITIPKKGSSYGNGNANKLEDTPPSTRVEVITDYVSFPPRREEYITRRTPQQKPIPNDGSIRVDFEEDRFIPWRDYIPQNGRTGYPTSGQPWYYRRRTTTTTTSTAAPPRLYTVKVDQWNRQVLNLTGQSFTGIDLKQALNELDEKTLSNIRYLILSYNRIYSNVPPFMFPVTLEYSLTELHLDHNDLYDLSNIMFEISRMINLRTLNLSHTRISSTNNIQSLSLPNLKNLDLSYNYLTYLPHLDYLPGLKWLDLTGNHITYLNYDIRLPNSLETLLLARNRLDYINPDEAKKSLKMLWKLDVSNNSLSRPSMVAELPILNIMMSGNPWECDCSMMLLTSSKAYTNIPDKRNVTCSYGGVEYLWPMDDLPMKFDIPCEKWYKWSKKAIDKLEDFMYWLKDIGGGLADVISFLGWVFFVFAVVLLALHRREVRTRLDKIKDAPKKVSAHEVPYTILDNKQTP